MMQPLIWYTAHHAPASRRWRHGTIVCTTQISPLHHVSIEIY